MSKKKQKLLKEIQDQITLLPLTFYNLNEIDSKSELFRKIKTKSNKRLSTHFQINDGGYKRISTL